MITKGFIESLEYQEFKQIMKDELQYKPVKIKTEGKTNEMIARELNAYEIASKALDKAIRRFEGQVRAEHKQKQNWV
jgi:hypothetical protein